MITWRVCGGTTRRWSSVMQLCFLYDLFVVFVFSNERLVLILDLNEPA